MEKMHRARYVGRSSELPCPLQSLPVSQHLPMFTRLEVLHTLSLGSVWRLYYVCMTD